MQVIDDDGILHALDLIFYSWISHFFNRQNVPLMCYIFIFIDGFERTSKRILENKDPFEKLSI
jgi:hypothetical protein